MTGPAPQLSLIRLAPNLERAAQLHRSILTLTHNALDAGQRETLNQLLGDFKSAVWLDAYQAAMEALQA